MVQFYVCTHKQLLGMTFEASIRALSVLFSTERLPTHSCSSPQGVATHSCSSPQRVPPHSCSAPIRPPAHTFSALNVVPASRFQHRTGFPASRFRPRLGLPASRFRPQIGFQCTFFRPPAHFVSASSTHFFSPKQLPVRGLFNFWVRRWPSKQMGFLHVLGNTQIMYINTTY